MDKLQMPHHIFSNLHHNTTFKFINNKYVWEKKNLQSFIWFKITTMLFQLWIYGVLSLITIINLFYSWLPLWCSYKPMLSPNYLKTIKLHCIMANDLTLPQLNKISQNQLIYNSVKWWEFERNLILLHSISISSQPI